MGSKSSLDRKFYSEIGRPNPFPTRGPTLRDISDLRVATEKRDRRRWRSRKRPCPWSTVACRFRTPRKAGRSQPRRRGPEKSTSSLDPEHAPPGDLDQHPAPRRRAERLRARRPMMPSWSKAVSQRENSSRDSVYLLHASTWLIIPLRTASITAAFAYSSEAVNRFVEDSTTTLSEEG
jgi:hypothetical protein